MQANAARQQVRDRIEALYLQFRADGMTHMQAARALRKSDELRSYAAGLNIDWETVKAFIIKMLPLLIMLFL